MIDIEAEVQARVEFKMNELLTAIKNRVIIHWNGATSSGSQKYVHYWEAFGELEKMLHKECQMTTPSDSMAKDELDRKKRIAINRLINRFCKVGEKDYQHKVNIIISTVEELQNGE